MHTLLVHSSLYSEPKSCRSTCDMLKTAGTGSKIGQMQETHRFSQKRCQLSLQRQCCQSFKVFLAMRSILGVDGHKTEQSVPAFKSSRITILCWAEKQTLTPHGKMWVTLAFRGKENHSMRLRGWDSSPRCQYPYIYIFDIQNCY